MGMQQPYVIGVDIGTGSTKALAVANSNNVLCTAQRFYSIAAEGEKSEQDPVAVWQAFQECLKEVVTKLGAPLAVSLSSAMHSLLAVGADGTPLTAAMLWADKRSAKIAEELRQTPKGESLYLATGTPLHAMSPLCKIRWLHDNDRQVFSRTAKFVSIKEFIWFQLFGEYCIDHSMASATGLFNIHRLLWEEEALGFAGITNEQLSLPVPVTYKKCGLDSTLATSLALPEHTSFFIGASDGVLANLGSLCLLPSQAAITIGTSAAVRITSTKPVEKAEQMIFNYLLHENVFVCGGAVSNGGNVFGWLLQNLFAQHEAIKSHEQLFRLVSTVAPGSDGLLFLPYLHGERAPVWDEGSSGVFVGITASHTLSHFARAAAEGVCFALCHVLSILEEACGAAEILSVSGGLVHAAEAMQILANITGKKVVVRQIEDASALGAVYLAQKALGLVQEYSSIEVKEGTTFRPQTEAAVHYRNLFPLYKNLYPLLKDTMHLLHQYSR